MANKPFYHNGQDWTIPLMYEALQHCEEIAVEELGLSLYPNQIEIVSSEQMLDAYSSHGMPIMFPHWSFGKSFVSNSNRYKKGQMGLAFEMVINSNPCINYMMEENSMTMQLLTIAHASCGHNHFFKNNYMFQEWTDPDAIIDYLSFAKKYIERCEEKYGIIAVEKTLDACNSLMMQGVDRYKHPAPLSKELINKLQLEREEEYRKQVHHLWDTVTTKKKDKFKAVDNFWYPDEENILYFMEKNAPKLAIWQRELCRIVRKINQYFYPQIQTKVGNEGCASFVHYYIMNRLHEKGLIDDGSMLEFLNSHTMVLYQPASSQFNPYVLGFEILSEIKRASMEPTKEDEKWFSDLCNTDWKKNVLHAISDFKDESLILQYLHPNTMRKFKMFSVFDDSNSSKYKIENIHNERGYKNIRSTLSKQYNLSNIFPEIEVNRVNLRGDRTLFLKHTAYNGIKLDRNAAKVLDNIQYLWGYKVSMASIDPETQDVLETFVVSD